MGLLNLFSQALTNNTYLSLEPSQDQALKKIVCSKAKKMRLQEFFKALPEYLSSTASQGQLSTQDYFQLKEYIVRLYDRYKKSSEKWPKKLLKTLAKYTPAFLKTFLPACFSDQIEKVEKATYTAFSDCLNALQETLHEFQEIHNWFNSLSETELLDKLFKADKNGVRIIDNIHPDNLKKTEFIELISIQNLQEAAKLNPSWPLHWKNKREDFKKIESFYLGLRHINGPLETKKFIFSQPLLREEQMASLAAIINENQLSLDNLQMTEEELLELCDHLRYVKLSTLPVDLGHKIIKKLTKPYTLHLASDAKYLEGLTSLEKCHKLICRGCDYALLPNLPLCKELSCSCCKNLTELPDLPHCTYLNCENCTNLKELPHLPNCAQLHCTDCALLTLLPQLPLCQELNCARCPLLTEFPDLPHCTRLYCFGCEKLTSLHDLSCCIELNCENCTRLKELSDLPKCIWLTCKRCPQLSSLPDLPDCLYLDCENCTSLASLPHLPNCAQLYCKGCTRLTSLPQLPLCSNLNCKNCTSLASLPDLPRCFDLDCSDCIHLISIPDLPNCNAINYIGCTSLITLPQLPPHATVYSAESANVSLFKVNIEELEHEPLKILRRLANIFRSGNPFPSIQYKEKGELNVAVDVGGVRRDFVGRLCHNLLSQTSDRSARLRLALNSKRYPLEIVDGENAYYTLGYLMGLCYRGVSRMKTGEMFPPVLYDCMRLSLEPAASNWQESAWTEANWRSLLSLKEKRMLWLAPRLFGENPSLSELNHKQQEWLDALKDQLDIAPEDFSSALLIERLAKKAAQEFPDELLPPFSFWKYAVKMAEGLKKVVSQTQWQAIVQEPSINLKAEVEGVLDKDCLIKNLVFIYHDYRGEELPTKDIENSKEFLEKWIQGATQSELGNFVRFVTGAPALDPNEKIKITPNMQSCEYLPVAHTCFFSLDLPCTYPSKEHLKIQLELAIKGSLVGSSFSLA